MAASHDDLDRLLMDNGYSQGDQGLSQGEALIWAVKENKIEIVQRLIDSGVDVNYKQPHGDEETACIVAAWKGFCDMLVMLHRAGANIDAGDKYGRTGLQQALVHGHGDAVRLLVKDLGASLTCQDQDGWTPLHQAARSNRCGALGMFYDRGVDINQRDHDGNSALHHACLKGSLEAAETLVEMGADTDWTRNDGATVMHLAAIYGEIQLA